MRNNSEVWEIWCWFWWRLRDWKKYKKLHSSLSFWWQLHFPSWMKEILEREIAFLWMSKRGLLLILWQHATCVQKLYLHLWEARHLLRNMFDTEFYFVFLFIFTELYKLTRQKISDKIRPKWLCYRKQTFKLCLNWIFS